MQLILFCNSMAFYDSIRKKNHLVIIVILCQTIFLDKNQALLFAFCMTKFINKLDICSICKVAWLFGILWQFFNIYKHWRLSSTGATNSVQFKLMVLCMFVQNKQWRTNSFFKQHIVLKLNSCIGCGKVDSFYISS